MAPSSNRARNKVVLFFLMSISGCLSPIGAALLGWLVFKGQAAGITYRRLPSAMRGLAVAGVGIGCLLGLLGLALLVFDH